MRRKNEWSKVVCKRMSTVIKLQLVAIKLQLVAISCKLKIKQLCEKLIRQIISL